MSTGNMANRKNSPREQHFEQLALMGGLCAVKITWSVLAIGLENGWARTCMLICEVYLASAMITSFAVKHGVDALASTSE